MNANGKHREKKRSRSPDDFIYYITLRKILIFSPDRHLLLTRRLLRI